MDQWYYLPFLEVPVLGLTSDLPIQNLYFNKISKCFPSKLVFGKHWAPVLGPLEIFTSELSYSHAWIYAAAYTVHKPTATEPW